MPSILVFDIGQVLIHWDPDLLYQKLIPDPEQRATFLRDILPPEWNVEQDRGRGWDEAIAERIAAHPDKADLIQAYRARWHEMVPYALDQNVKVLEAAKAQGIPCYAITNFAADTLKECQQRFAFLQSFDGMIVSGQERLIKPDPAIFELFLSRFNLKAEDCLFMDDSAKNIATAQSLGFNTVHVLPNTDLAQEVAKAGFILT